MPDAAGNFKGISVPRLPWKEPVGCDRCGLAELPRDEAVEVTVVTRESEFTAWYCGPCASAVAQ